MKKTFKWLLPVLVIALLVGVLCFSVSAEETPEVEYTPTGGETIQTSYNAAIAAAQTQGGTIKLLTDVTGATTFIPAADGVELTIDVGAHTLDYKDHTAKVFSIGKANVTLTIKGTGKFTPSEKGKECFYINKSNATGSVINLQGYDNSEKLTFEVNNGSAAFNLSDGTLNVDNVDIIVNGYTAIFYQASNNGRTAANFTDSIITINGVGSQKPFYLKKSSNTVTFKGVVINNNVNTDVFNLVSGTTAVLENTTINSSYSIFTGAGKVTVKDGVVVTENGWKNKTITGTVTLPDGYVPAYVDDSSVKFVDTDSCYDVTFDDATGTYVKYYMPEYTPTLDSSVSGSQIVVDDKGVKKVEALYSGWLCEGELVTVLTPAVDGKVLTPGEGAPAGIYATWAIFNADETEATHHSINDGPNLPADTNELIGEYGILRLYTDLTYTPGDNVRLPNGAVIDLNGNKLTMAGFRFYNIGDEGKGYTIKNGTLDSSSKSDNLFYSGTASKGYASFVDVTFITAQQSQDVAVFDIRGGTLNVNGCIYEGSTSNFISAGWESTDGNPISININGGTYNTSGYFIRIKNFGTNNLLNLDVKVFGDTTITCNRLVWMSTRYNSTTSNLYDPASTVDMSFTGVKVTATADQLVSSSVDTVFNLTFGEGCQFNIDPTLTAGAYPPDSVTYPKGQRPVEKIDTEYTYKYEIKAIDLDVDVNLTLYSDFNLNLYLPNNVTGVEVDGVAALLEKYSDDQQYTVANSISPSKAADGITFRIVYVEDGKEYAVKYDYSVIAYANKLLATDTAEANAAKSLVASIVRYIDAAYTYEYENAEKPAALTALMASSNYENAITDIATDVNGANNTADLAGVIDSANLRLSGECYYRLNLVAGFSGTLNVNGKEFVIENGTYDGNTYLDIKLPARDFNDGLTITASADGQSYLGSYTLADYIDYAEENNETNLIALTYALYTYAELASDYVRQ